MEPSAVQGYIHGRAWHRWLSDQRFEQIKDFLVGVIGHQVMYLSIGWSQIFPEYFVKKYLSTLKWMFSATSVIILPGKYLGNGIFETRKLLNPANKYLGKGFLKLEHCWGRGADNQNGNLRWLLPWRGGGLECHIPILKNNFFENHLESFPDC